jgi:hypothetical protein
MQSGIDVRRFGNRQLIVRRARFTWRHFLNIVRAQDFVIRIDGEELRDVCVSVGWESRTTTK